VILYKKQHPIT